MKLSTKKKIQMFPWISSINHLIAVNFRREHDLDYCHELQKNVVMELWSAVSAEDFTKGINLYTVLNDYIYHFHLRADEEFRSLFEPFCVRLVSCLVDLCIFLSEGDPDAIWLSEAVKALFLYTGGRYNLMWDSLLNCLLLLKKKYSEVSHPIMKRVLQDHPEKIEDPKQYMTFLYLSRKLKIFSSSEAEKSEAIALSGKPQPPAETISWLLSQELESLKTIKVCKSARKMAKFIMDNKFPPSFYLELRQVLCQGLQKSSEDLFVKYEVAHQSEKVESLFCIDKGDSEQNFAAGESSVPAGEGPSEVICSDEDGDKSESVSISELKQKKKHKKIKAKSNKTNMDKKVKTSKISKIKKLKKKVMRALDNMSPSQEIEGEECVNVEGNVSKSFQVLNTSHEFNIDENVTLKVSCKKRKKLKLKTSEPQQLKDKSKKNYETKSSLSLCTKREKKNILTQSSKDVDSTVIDIQPKISKIARKKKPNTDGKDVGSSPKAKNPQLNSEAGKESHLPKQKKIGKKKKIAQPSLLPCVSSPEMRNPPLDAECAVRGDQSFKNGNDISKSADDHNKMKTRKRKRKEFEAEQPQPFHDKPGLSPIKKKKKKNSKTAVTKLDAPGFLSSEGNETECTIIDQTLSSIPVDVNPSSILSKKEPGSSTQINKKRKIQANAIMMEAIDEFGSSSETIDAAHSVEESVEDSVRASNSNMKSDIDGDTPIKICNKESGLRTKKNKKSSKAVTEIVDESCLLSEVIDTDCAVIDQTSEESTSVDIDKFTPIKLSEKELGPSVHSNKKRKKQVKAAVIEAVDEFGSSSEIIDTAHSVEESVEDSVRASNSIVKSDIDRATPIKICKKVTGSSPQSYEESSNTDGIELIDISSEVIDTDCSITDQTSEEIVSVDVKPHTPIKLSKKEPVPSAQSNKKRKKEAKDAVIEAVDEFGSSSEIIDADHSFEESVDISSEVITDQTSEETTSVVDQLSPVKLSKIETRSSAKKPKRIKKHVRAAFIEAAAEFGFKDQTSEDSISIDEVTPIEICEQEPGPSPQIEKKNFRTVDESYLDCETLDADCSVKDQISIVNLSFLDSTKHSVDQDASIRIPKIKTDSSTNNKNNSKAAETQLINELCLSSEMTDDCGINSKNSKDCLTMSYSTKESNVHQDSGKSENKFEKEGQLICADTKPEDPQPCSELKIDQQQKKRKSVLREIQEGNDSAEAVFHSIAFDNKASSPSSPIKRRSTRISKRKSNIMEKEIPHENVLKKMKTKNSLSLEISKAEEKEIITNTEQSDSTDDKVQIVSPIGDDELNQECNSVTEKQRNNLLMETVAMEDHPATECNNPESHLNGDEQENISEVIESKKDLSFEKDKECNDKEIGQDTLMDVYDKNSKESPNANQDSLSVVQEQTYDKSLPCSASSVSDETISPCKSANITTNQRAIEENVQSVVAPQATDGDSTLDAPKRLFEDGLNSASREKQICLEKLENSTSVNGSNLNKQDESVPSVHEDAPKSITIEESVTSIVGFIDKVSIKNDVNVSEEVARGLVIHENFPIASKVVICAKSEKDDLSDGEDIALSIAEESSIINNPIINALSSVHVGVVKCHTEVINGDVKLSGNSTLGNSLLNNEKSKDFLAIPECAAKIENSMYLVPEDTATYSISQLISTDVTNVADDVKIENSMYLVPEDSATCSVSQLISTDVADDPKSRKNSVNRMSAESFNIGKKYDNISLNDTKNEKDLSFVEDAAKGLENSPVKGNVDANKSYKNCHSVCEDVEKQSDILHTENNSFADDPEITNVHGMTAKTLTPVKGNVDANKSNSVREDVEKQSDILHTETNSFADDPEITNVHGVTAKTLTVVLHNCLHENFTPTGGTVTNNKNGEINGNHTIAKDNLSKSVNPEENVSSLNNLSSNDNVQDSKSCDAHETANAKNTSERLFEVSTHSSSASQNVPNPEKPSCDDPSLDSATNERIDTQTSSISKNSEREIVSDSERSTGSQSLILDNSAHLLNDKSLSTKEQHAEKQPRGQSASKALIQRSAEGGLRASPKKLLPLSPLRPSRESSRKSARVSRSNRLFGELSPKPPVHDRSLILEKCIEKSAEISFQIKDKEWDVDFSDLKKSASEQTPPGPELKFLDDDPEFHSPVTSDCEEDASQKTTEYKADETNGTTIPETGIEVQESSVITPKVSPCTVPILDCRIAQENSFRLGFNFKMLCLDSPMAKRMGEDPTDDDLDLTFNSSNDFAGSQASSEKSEQHYSELSDSDDGELTSFRRSKRSSVTKAKSRQSERLLNTAKKSAIRSTKTTAKRQSQASAEPKTDAERETTSYNLRSRKSLIVPPRLNI